MIIRSSNTLGRFLVMLDGFLAGPEQFQSSDRGAKSGEFGSQLLQGNGII